MSTQPTSAAFQHMVSIVALESECVECHVSMKNRMVFLIVGHFFVIDLYNQCDNLSLPVVPRKAVADVSKIGNL